MKKHYKLNKKKFGEFCINCGLVTLFSAMTLGMLYAILMSPEW